LQRLLIQRVDHALQNPFRALEADQAVRAQPAQRGDGGGAGPSTRGRDGVSAGGGGG
jgi:hypothetical protein